MRLLTCHSAWAAAPAQIFRHRGGVDGGGAADGLRGGDWRGAPTWNLSQVRGMEGIRELSIDIGGQTVRVAVAHGLKNAGLLLAQIREGPPPPLARGP